MDTLRCSDFIEKEQYHFAPLFAGWSVGPGFVWLETKEEKKTFFYQHPEDPSPVEWKPCYLTRFIKL